MIFLIPFVALLIWQALYGKKEPYIDPVKNEAERRRLMALIDQMEYDRMVEYGRVCREAHLKRQQQTREKINELCKESIDKLTAQFEKGELTQQEYDEGLDAIFDEMKINLSS